MKVKILSKAAVFTAIFFLHSLFADENEKANRLIDHVIWSIANAEQGISKLNEGVLNIEGMSGSIVRHFLNNLCSLDHTNYFEIGTWKGSTLVSAAYGNREHLSDVVAIDNWSEFVGLTPTRNEFFNNINRFVSDVPIRFFDQNCFSINKEQIFHAPVTIYFYDGDHIEKYHKAAFTYFDSIFDDVFIAVVDDWNWERVRKGTFDAFNELGYKVLFEQGFYTKGNDPHSWWNGIYVAVVQKRP